MSKHLQASSEPALTKGASGFQFSNIEPGSTRCHRVNLILISQYRCVLQPPGRGQPEPGSSEDAGGLAREP